MFHHIAYLTGGVLIRTVGSGSRSGSPDVSNSVVGCQMLRKKAFELCCHASTLYGSAQSHISNVERLHKVRSCEADADPRVDCCESIIYNPSILPPIIINKYKNTSDKARLFH